MMSDLKELVNLEIPGFMVICLSDAGDVGEPNWGVVRVSDRRVVQIGLGSEQEARECAGTASIRLRVKEYARAAVRDIASKAAVAFMTTPLIKEYGRGSLETTVRHDIMHCVEKEQPGWIKEVLDGIENRSWPPAASKERGDEQELMKKARIPQPEPEKSE